LAVPALKVSTLTMGTMPSRALGRSPPSAHSDVSEAKRIIDTCIDAGINLIDTSNVYFQRAVGGDHRRSARRQAQGRRADRLKGAHADRQRPQ